MLLLKFLVALAGLSVGGSRVERFGSSSVVALADVAAVSFLKAVPMACGSLRASCHDEIAGLASTVDCAQLLAAAAAEPE